MIKALLCLLLALPAHAQKSSMSADFDGSYQTHLLDQMGVEIDALYGGRPKIQSYITQRGSITFTTAGSGILWADGSISTTAFPGSGSFSITTNASLLGTGTSANPLMVNPSSGTLQGNTFNGSGQLIQTTAAGKYPALDGSLITNLPAATESNTYTSSKTFTSDVLIKGVLTSSIPVSGGTAAILISNNDPTNSNDVLTIKSTGPVNSLTITNYGFPHNGVQAYNTGTVNIQNYGAGPSVLIVSSHTSYQSGDSALLVRQMSSNWDDPLIRVIDENEHKSGPQMRVDAAAPNFEYNSTSSDSAHGLGKWEVNSIAYQASNLQVNSRCYDNTSYEKAVEYQPLSQGGGMILYPAINATCGNPVTSAAAQLIWGTTNNHQVGLAGPSSTTASWNFTLPRTPNNGGQVLYQASNTGIRDWEFTTGGSAGQVLTHTGGGAPTWTTVTGGSGETNTFTSSKTFTTDVGVGGTFYVTGTQTNISTLTVSAQDSSGYSLNTSSGIDASAGVIKSTAVTTARLYNLNGKAFFTTACSGTNNWVTSLGSDGTVNCQGYVSSDFDTVVGNEVTNVTDASLKRSGGGSTISPYTLAINPAFSNTWTVNQTFNSSATMSGLSVSSITIKGGVAEINALGAIETGSSVTASAYFGDGEYLTGIPSSASIVGVYLPLSGGTITGNLVTNSSINANGTYFGDGSKLTGIPSTSSISGVYLPLVGGTITGTLTQTGASSFINTGSSINASAYFGDGSHLSNLPSASGENATYSASTKTFTQQVQIGGAGQASSPTTLNVDGNAQFGSGATKSTFSTTGALTLASGATAYLGSGATFGTGVQISTIDSTGAAWLADNLYFATGKTELVTTGQSAWCAKSATSACMKFNTNANGGVTTTDTTGTKIFGIKTTGEVNVGPLATGHISTFTTTGDLNLDGFFTNRSSVNASGFFGDNTHLTGQCVNPKAPPFNAKGDGSTDDTAAVQAAINSATSSIVAPYGQVCFPEGTYNLCQVDLSTRNVHLIGRGMMGTILQGTCNSDLISAVNSSADNGVQLENIKLQYNTPRTGVSLLKLQNVSLCAIHQVEFSRGGSAITFTGSSGLCSITDSVFGSNNTVGIDIENGSQAITIANNWFNENLSTGIYVRGSGNNAIIGNRFASNARSSIWLDQNATSNTITGNTFQVGTDATRFGQKALQLDGASNNVITGNVFEDFSASGTIIINSGSVNNVFAGNIIRGSFTDGGTGTTLINPINGSVGIGMITTPASTLDVNGSMNIKDAGTYNVGGNSILKATLGSGITQLFSAGTAIRFNSVLGNETARITDAGDLNMAGGSVNITGSAGYLTSKSSITAQGILASSITITNNLEVQGNSFSVGTSTFIIKNSSVAINTVQYTYGGALYVNGAAVFGGGAIKSTFTATGDLNMASGGAINTIGSVGYLTSKSSVNAQGIFAPSHVGTSATQKTSNPNPGHWTPPFVSTAAFLNMSVNAGDTWNTWDMSGTFYRVCVATQTGTSTLANYLVIYSSMAPNGLAASKCK